MLKKAVTGGKRPPFIDIGLGFALLKDRRVPVRAKGTALLLGAVATAGLQFNLKPWERRSCNQADPAGRTRWRAQQAI